MSTQEERRLMARLAGHEAWSREPGRPATLRADSLRKAHRTRLELRVVQGQRAVREATDALERAQSELAAMDSPA